MATNPTVVVDGVNGREFTVERLGRGIVRIERRQYRERDVALWTSARLRKPNRCAATGAILDTGTEAYRPSGNQGYRYERIRADVIDRAVP